MRVGGLIEQVELNIEEVGLNIEGGWNLLVGGGGGDLIEMGLELDKKRVGPNREGRGS